MNIHLPDDADWFLWRVVFHKRNSASLWEIENLWSFEDLAMAGEVLDALDNAEMAAHDNGS